VRAQQALLCRFSNKISKEERKNNGEEGRSTLVIPGQVSIWATCKRKEAKKTPRRRKSAEKKEEKGSH